MVLSSQEEKAFLQSRSLPLPQSASATTTSKSIRSAIKAFLITTLILFGLANLDLLQPASISSSSTSNDFYSSQTPTDLSSHRSVRWLDCSTKSNPSFVCSYINVPKDYTNSSSGVASIAVSKFPSTSKPEDKLGAIFINPGGPGGSGFDFAFRFANQLSSILDGRYDIIGFDPRSIGRTRPLVSCFDSEYDFDLFKSHTVLENGITLPPQDILETELGYELVKKQLEEQTSLRKTAYEKCDSVMGDELRHMSTNTVVRDIDRMSRVLYGDDAPINFFGASYGTILGAYLVNMLPSERIGRVIIDGVASAPDWANKPPYLWLHDWLKYTNTTYEWFLSDCSKAGPFQCPLAKSKGEEPSQIAQRLETFLDNLYDNPASVPNGIRPGILNSGAARSHLYLSTNLPQLWPLFAELFAEALDGDPTRLYNSRVPPFPADKTSKIQTDLSRVAVSCGDSPPYEIKLKNGDYWEKPSSKNLTDEIMRTLRDRSRQFAASVSFEEPDGQCEFHPSNIRGPPERFTGPWNNTLSTPMLIISNTADPITPLSSGQEINELMGSSSRLLIQDSPGHCSLGSVSNCTTTHYRRYYLEGYLPEDNLKCGIDAGFFPIKNLDAGAAQADGSDLNHAERRSRGWNDWVLSQI